MNNIAKHMDILGRKVRDRVTRLEGVATCLSFDLYGCIQVVVTPGVGADGKLDDSKWFDVSRLDVLDATRVMHPPDFAVGPIAEGKQGPAEKPMGRNY